MDKKGLEINFGKRKIITVLAWNNNGTRADLLAITGHKLYCPVEPLQSRPPGDLPLWSDTLVIQAARCGARTN